MFFIRFHDRVGHWALWFWGVGFEWSRIPFLMGSTSDKDPGSRTRTQSRASDKALQKL